MCHRRGLGGSEGHTAGARLCVSEAFVSPSVACTAPQSGLPFLVPSEYLWGAWGTVLARSCVGPVCRAHSPADQHSHSCSLGSADGNKCLCCCWSCSGPVLSASEWPPGWSGLRGQSRLHLRDTVDVGLPLVVGSVLIRRTLFKLATEDARDWKGSLPRPAWQTIVNLL